MTRLKRIKGKIEYSWIGLIINEVIKTMKQKITRKKTIEQEP